MGQVRVAVLGGPQVQHEGVALAFPTRKALALFVYLVVEGGQQPREKLAALLWPDSDRSHARAMLRYTLADIRRTLQDSGEDQHIIVERDTLGVDTASGIDLDLDMLRTVQVAAQTGTLSELRHVVAYCRGDFLEGFTLPDAASFDEWTTLQRESGLRGMELVFDRLSQLEADCGDSNAATGTLRQWLAISPLDEEAHRRLMRLQFAGGDRSAALQTYDSCCALLERELHLAPAAETEALAERIRADGDQRRTPPRTAGRAAVSLDFFEGPLVGRSGEFARLGAVYQTARRGQAQVVVVRGEPGIGKTRLAREFVGWAAAQGTDVLQGRAFETGGRLPYQPLVDALRPRLERENAPEDLLSDIWLVELGSLLPELRERYPDLPRPALEEAAARMRLFEAIARLGQALGQREPVVLFVDDLQWADIGSLDALQYAARRWSDEGTPVVVLLSVRSEALATDSVLADWLISLPRAIAVTHVELGPLMARDTLHFVQRVAAGSDQAQIDALARWLHGETAGQPLFLLETLRALLERKAVVSRSRADGSWSIALPPALMDELPSDTALPPGVRDMIRARLTRLAPTDRELLAAGSVLGQGFTFDELRQVARLTEIDALAAIDDVLRANVVREATTADGSAVGGYVFAHDKIREVVYAEAGDARRRVFHRRALEMLESVGSAAQLAHHALAAGLDAAGLRYSRAAGDEAVRLLAARDAVVHYQRALEIAKRLGATADVVELHARSGKALARLGRWVDARPELEASLAGFDQGPEQAEQRADVLVDLLEVCWWWLDVPSVRRRAAELAELAQELQRPGLRTGAISWLAPTMSADGDVAGSITHSEHWFARCRELGVPPPPPVQAYMSLMPYWLGRIEDAVERCQESVDAARAASHASATMFALPHLGITLAATGRYAEAAAAFAEARRFGREHGIGTLLARAVAMSAGYHLDVFDFAGNEAIAQEARELARSLNFSPPAISAGIDLMLNFARREEVGRAEQLIDEVAEVAARATAWHGWLWRIRVGQAQAEIALARGDWQAALESAGLAVQASQRHGRVKYEVLGLAARARALHALGRTRAAIESLRTAAGLARPVGDAPLFLRAAVPLLELDGDDALAVEAAATAQRVAASLHDQNMRRCFENALPRSLLARPNATATGYA